MSNEQNLKGLRGWLLLVALGLVLSPIRILFVQLPIYNEIFADGTWEALTTPGSEVYHSLWAPLLTGEIIFNFAMLLASLYLVYLFFSKHYLFPKVYIIVVLVALVFIPLDAWLVAQVLPGEPLFDAQSLQEFIRVLVSACIWIPYMLVSKRVKATFVEGRANKEMVAE